MMSTRQQGSASIRQRKHQAAQAHSCLRVGICDVGLESTSAQQGWRGRSQRLTEDAMNIVHLIPSDVDGCHMSLRQHARGWAMCVPGAAPWGNPMSQEASFQRRDLQGMQKLMLHLHLEVWG